jgi:hypothetical protein
VLAAAKAKSEISVLPQASTLIEDCFRTRRAAAGADGGPAPIIIKLTSPSLKVAIMRNKRGNIPAPSRSDVSAGQRPVYIVEDLTQATHTKMRELKDDRRVNKIWTVDGQIRLTLTDSPDRIIKVKSVYDDKDKILR